MKKDEYEDIVIALARKTSMQFWVLSMTEPMMASPWVSDQRKASSEPGGWHVDDEKKVRPEFMEPFHFGD